MAKFFLFPFAEDGDKATVENDTQPSGVVSYESGWGEDYEKPLATDPTARPIPRDQFNQILFDITDAIRQYQTLGTPDFITSADNGGSPYSYDIYATVRYDAGSGYKIYESQEGSNTSLPTDATKWRVISGSAQGNVPGTVIDFAGPFAPEGYLECDGSAISRTTYADLYEAVTQTQDGTLINATPIVTGLSSTSEMFVGMIVEGADLQANTAILTIDSSTQITLDKDVLSTGINNLRFFYHGAGNGTTTFNVPDARRRTSIGSGGTGTAVIGNVTGQKGGQETHTLTIGEMPSHTHAMNNNGGIPTDQAGSPHILDGNINQMQVSSIAHTGGDGPHNNMQPSIVMKKCIKT